MKFDFIIVFISLIITGYAALYEINFLEYEKPIPYSQLKTIGWEDFRGIKRTDDNLYGRQEFAYIFTEIEFIYLSDSSFEITTYFHPCRSYVFNKKAANQSMLEHELCHFRLSEYCARLLRKEISELPVNTDKSEIKDIKEKYMQTEKSIQFQYDDETLHSYVLCKQKEWEMKVSKWLDSLKLYENPNVIIGMKKK